MPSPRKILAEKGLAAHKDRGQNFLAHPAVARDIVRLADLKADDRVLEIGPGLGALTRPMLEAGCNVVAIELDRGLAQVLETDLLPQFPRQLTIIQKDVLKVSWTALAEEQGQGFCVVGNLPYQISSPVLLKILDERSAVTQAVLMFQKELAQRLTAGPGTKDYGRLSVLLGYYVHLERLMDLGPEAFHPRPKVHSTVLKLTFKDSPQPPLRSDRLFRQVLAAAFSRRRKTLKNSLTSAFPPEEIVAALDRAGIDPGRRAETLSVAEFVILANAF